MNQKGSKMGARTLIVGLGGTGLQIVEKVAKRALREDCKSVAFVVLDTEADALKGIEERTTNVRTVPLSSSRPVGEVLDANSSAKTWFPYSSGLKDQTFGSGAGQVRAITRLAFDQTAQEGGLSAFDGAIGELYLAMGEAHDQPTRIVTVGSLAGGTGSGLILPVAMYLRRWFEPATVEISGYFLQPDTLFDGKDEGEKNSLRCNAYATVRELAAFTKKYSSNSKDYKYVAFNAPVPNSTGHENYPSLLPYNFIFLMGAATQNGEKLANAEAYIEHLADTMYTRVLGPASDKAYANENNVEKVVNWPTEKRSLEETRGLARFAGAGSYYLEYPMREVQRYVGLTWADHSVSQEWLEIDREYMKALRKGDVRDRRSHYINQFEAHQKSSNNRFYVKVSRGLRKRVGKTEQRADQSFVEALRKRAIRWNLEELGTHSDELQRVFGIGDPPTIPSIKSILQEAGKDTTDAEADIARVFQDYYDYYKDYYGAVLSDVAKEAALGAEWCFEIPEGNVNLLASHKEDWQLEYYIRRDGVLHPSGVRYLLYSISLILEENIDGLEADINEGNKKIRAILEGDFYIQDDAKDDISSAVQKCFKEGARKGVVAALQGVIRGIFAKSGYDEGVLNSLTAVADELSPLKGSIDKLRQDLVTVEFFKRAKIYVDMLSRSFEGFYKRLESGLAEIEREIQSIESRSDFNSFEGVTHRYICASKTCLKEIVDLCPVIADGGDVPSEVRSTVYNTLLHLSQPEDVSGESASYDSKIQTAIDKLYKSAILDFWVDRVLSNINGYPQIVDKSIAEAIVDEIKYLKPVEADDSVTYEDSVTDESYIHGEIERTIGQAFRKAMPYVNYCLGTRLHNTSVIAYSKKGLSKKGPEGKYYDTFQAAFKAGTGVGGAVGGMPDVLPGDKMDKHQMIFTSASYVLLPSELSQYTPEFHGLRYRPEGEYHRAYWEYIRKLGPDLEQNDRITPHIDRNWHLVAYLPDIDEEYESRIKSEIVQAFINGIVQGRFEATVQSGLYGEITYSVNCGGESHQLITDNGTKNDRFYEVYDALKINPPLVSSLLYERDEQIRREFDAITIPPIQDSAFLKHIQSKAFTNYNEQNYVDEIVVKISNLIAGNATPDSEVDYLKPEHMVRLFDSYAPELADDEQRSLFLIPLLYRLSLPYGVGGKDEFKEITSGVIDCLDWYISHYYGDESYDWQESHDRLLEDQLFAFERNLVSLESRYPAIHSSDVVRNIRMSATRAVKNVKRRAALVRSMTTISYMWKSFEEHSA